MVGQGRKVALLRDYGNARKLLDRMLNISNQNKVSSVVCIIFASLIVSCYGVLIGCLIFVLQGLDTSVATPESVCDYNDSVRD